MNSLNASIRSLATAHIHGEFFSQYPQPQPMTIEHDIDGRNEESENEIDERRTQKRDENGRGKNARTLNPFDMQTSPQHVIYRSVLCVFVCSSGFFLLLVLWSYSSKLQYISLYFLYSFFGWWNAHVIVCNRSICELCKCKGTTKEEDERESNKKKMRRNDWRRDGPLLLCFFSSVMETCHERSENEKKKRT